MNLPKAVIVHVLCCMHLPGERQVVEVIWKHSVVASARWEAAGEEPQPWVSRAWCDIGCAGSGAEPPCLSRSLGKGFGWESWHLLPLLLFSHFHKGGNCLPLREHSIGCPKNDRHVVLPGIYRDHTIWTWEYRGETEMGMSLLQTGALRHLMWQMNVLEILNLKIKVLETVQMLYSSRRIVTWYSFCILQSSFLWIA